MAWLTMPGSVISGSDSVVMCRCCSRIGERRIAMVLRSGRLVRWRERSRDAIVGDVCQ